MVNVDVTPLHAFTLCASVAGVWSIGSAIKQLLVGRLLRGSITAGLGLLLLAGGGFALGVIINLDTYERLTNETLVADVMIDKLGLQRYRVRLSDAEQNTRIFDLVGDEWQIDARILKWQGWAALLGFDTLYRFERISGRYKDIDQERHQPRSVYELGSERGFDLWEIAHRNPDRLPGIDAVYGNAAYLPLSHGAHYVVSVGQSGLIARAANDSAREAIANW